MFNLTKTTLYTAFIVSFSLCSAIRCMESEMGTLSGYEGDTEALNTNDVKSANRVQPKSPELKIPAVVCAYYNNSKAKSSSLRPTSATPTKTSSLQNIQENKDTHSFQPITTSATPAITRIQSEEFLAKKKIPAITRVMSESNMPSCCKMDIQRRSVTTSPTSSPFTKKTLADTHDSSDSDSNGNRPDSDYEQSSLSENKK